MYRFFIKNNQVVCSIHHENYNSSEELDKVSPIMCNSYDFHIDHEADKYPSLWQYNAETEKLYKLDYLTCKAEVESSE